LRLSAAAFALVVGVVGLDDSVQAKASNPIAQHNAVPPVRNVEMST